jgi:hypothetical protein
MGLSVECTCLVPRSVCLEGPRYIAHVVPQLQNSTHLIRVHSNRLDGILIISRTPISRKPLTFMGFAQGTNGLMVFVFYTPPIRNPRQHIFLMLNHFHFSVKGIVALNYHAQQPILTTWLSTSKNLDVFYVRPLNKYVIGLDF